METRYVVIAVLIVLGAILFLSYRPGDDHRAPADRPRATDRIVELPEVRDDVPVARVDLDAPPPIADQPAGSGADAQLIRRFEAERADPTRSPVMAERLSSVLVPEVEARGGSVAEIECRQTACRVRLAFADAAARPAAVNELMTILAERRHVALIERVENNRVTLLIEP